MVSSGLMSPSASPGTPDEDLHGLRLPQDQAESARSEVAAVDGHRLPGRAYSPFDVIGLHAATHAPGVRFDLATGVCSSRPQGQGVTAELVVTVEGTRRGLPAGTRSTLRVEQGGPP